MKISGKLKNKYFKGAIIIVVCYLLASMGVNKVANPKYYFTEYSGHPIGSYEENDRLYIDVSKLSDTDQFLNIYIEELQKFGSMTYLYSGTNDKERVYVLLCKGNNSIRKSDLPLNEGSIYIRIDDMNNEGIEISQITGSESPYVHTFPMLKVFICFMLLSIFWQFMNYLKGKYAS